VSTPPPTPTRVLYALELAGNAAERTFLARRLAETRP